jgi:hypothetical protein
VSAWGDGYDSVSHVRKQQIGKREVAEVVRPDLRLEAVRRTPLGRSHDAGIIDQHIAVALPRVRECTFRCQVGEIEATNLTISRNGLGSRLTFSRVAHGKHHMSAGLRECPRGGQPDAAVSTSDDEDAPSLRWQVGSGPAS